MKGIILAGGTGSRLYPLTKVVCKQLLPIYDKPLIYYPLSTLMLAGITEILIISTCKDINTFKTILKNGNQFGLKLSYAVQDEPTGIVDAFIIGEGFIDKNPVCLILGDNIFYGHNLPGMLREAVNDKENSTIFAYFVKDPERYGVVDFDENNNVMSIEEKPDKPKTNYAVVGLYVYNNKVVEYSKQIKPSKRGEKEITELNKIYLKENRLKVKKMGRGFAWLDAGTFDSMIEASNFVKTIEDRQGLKISCIEEISYRMGYIDAEQLKHHALSYNSSDYGKYLMNVLDYK